MSPVMRRNALTLIAAISERLPQKHLRAWLAIEEVWSEGPWEKALIAQIQLRMTIGRAAGESTEPAGRISAKEGCQKPQTPQCTEVSVDESTRRICDLCNHLKRVKSADMREGITFVHALTMPVPSIKRQKLGGNENNEINVGAVDNEVNRHECSTAVMNDEDDRYPVEKKAAEENEETREDDVVRALVDGDENEGSHFASQMASQMVYTQYMNGAEESQLAQSQEVVDRPTLSATDEAMVENWKTSFKSLGETTAELPPGFVALLQSGEDISLHLQLLDLGSESTPDRAFALLSQPECTSELSYHSCTSLFEHALLARILSLKEHPSRSLTTAVIDLTLMHPQPGIRGLLVPLLTSSVEAGQLGQAQCDLVQRIVKDGLKEDARSLLMRELANLSFSQPWSTIFITTVQLLVNGKTRPALGQEEILSFVQAFQEQSALNRENLKFWGLLLTFMKKYQDVLLLKNVDASYAENQNVSAEIHTALSGTIGACDCYLRKSLQGALAKLILAYA